MFRQHKQCYRLDSDNKIGLFKLNTGDFLRVCNASSLLDACKWNTLYHPASFPVKRNQMNKKSMTDELHRSKLVLIVKIQKKKQTTMIQFPNDSKFIH